ncbi:hypothetical protein [Brevifollis gellanilyticus]|uniref:Uncharacterized protein n=1 Tax=Brevifollis gellanilyticus TaxID=748831 RepID=A0A512M6L7_9BACT|nr:hypothetical protein [Brevifollis gellanilyticus]GEP42377.1 hypothetical protein BGE01nite_16680 [Brevifollis gellanilyticus]
MRRLCQILFIPYLIMAWLAADLAGQQPATAQEQASPSSARETPISAEQALEQYQVHESPKRFYEDMITLLEKEPENARLCQWLYQFCISLGDARQAHIWLTDYLALQPELAQEPKFEQLKQQLAEASPRQAITGPVLLEYHDLISQGKRSLEKGEAGVALDLSTQACLLYREGWEALALMSAAHLKQGFFPEALAEIEAAAQSAPDAVKEKLAALVSEVTLVESGLRLNPEAVQMASAGKVEEAAKLCEAEWRADKTQTQNGFGAVGYWFQCKKYTKALELAKEVGTEAGRVAKISPEKLESVYKPLSQLAGGGASSSQTASRSTTTKSSSSSRSKSSGSSTKPSAPKKSGLVGDFLNRIK